MSTFHTVDTYSRCTYGFEYVQFYYILKVPSFEPYSDWLLTCFAPKFHSKWPIFFFHLRTHSVPISCSWENKSLLCFLTRRIRGQVQPRENSVTLLSAIIFIGTEHAIWVFLKKTKTWTTSTVQSSLSSRSATKSEKKQFKLFIVPVSYDIDLQL